MSELKLTEKCEKWISELAEQLSDGTEKLIILEPEQCKGLHLVLSARDTRPASPQFTAEEREAMSVVLARSLQYGTAFFDTFRTATEIKANERDRVIFLKQVATVRAMLTASEIADKCGGTIE